METLVCDRKVMLEQATWETDKITGQVLLDLKTGKPKLGTYQKITGQTVAIESNEKDAADEKDTNKMRVAGPGTVTLMQRGAVDPLAPTTPTGDPAKPKPADPAKPKSASKPDEEQEMKLTYIEFNKTMLANNKTGKANFWGGVRVLNMPGDDPSAEIDLDVLVGRLPKGAMYLVSEQLEVLSVKPAGGKSYQQMTATRRVWVKGNEFEANCEKLDYDEAKDQIVLYGSENGQATLYRYLKMGDRPEAIQGQEITYIRSTGAFNVKKVRSLTN